MGVKQGTGEAKALKKQMKKEMNALNVKLVIILQKLEVDV